MAIRPPPPGAPLASVRSQGSIANRPDGRSAPTPANSRSSASIAAMIRSWSVSNQSRARAKLVIDFGEQVLAGNDVAVLPVMAIPTPSAAECDPNSERFSPRTLYALSRFTRFVNMLGFPAVALPAGFDDRGMPVAVQIVGRAGSDRALLDLVRQVQSTTDWHGRVPAAIGHLVPDLESLR